MFDVLHHQEHVVMARENGQVADLDRVQPLGAADDAEDETAHFGPRNQEQPALHRPAGDFDQGSRGWDVAELSHAHGRRKIPLGSCRLGKDQEAGFWLESDRAKQLDIGTSPRISSPDGRSRGFGGNKETG